MTESEQKDKEKQEKEIKLIDKHINLLIKVSLFTSLIILIIYLISLFV